MLEGTGVGGGAGGEAVARFADDGFLLRSAPSLSNVQRVPQPWFVYKMKPAKLRSAAADARATVRMDTSEFLEAVRQPSPDECVLSAVPP